MLVHRVNKLHATDLSIFRSLVQVHSYGSFLQSILPRIPNDIDRIRLTFSVAIGTKSTNAIKYSPEITAVLGDRAHKHIK